MLSLNLKIILSVIIGVVIKQSFDIQSLNDKSKKSDVIIEQLLQDKMKLSEQNASLQKLLDIEIARSKYLSQLILEQSKMNPLSDTTILGVETSTFIFLVIAVLGVGVLWQGGQIKPAISKLSTAVKYADEDIVQLKTSITLLSNSVNNLTSSFEDVSNIYLAEYIKRLNEKTITLAVDVVEKSTMTDSGVIQAIDIITK